MRPCVIIPAFNEASSVGGVIAQVRAYVPEADIVVINDGSRDATKEVAESEGALVVDLPFNLGIGGAVQTGLKWAHGGGYAVAVEIDADGQHDPQFLPALVQAVTVGGADMAIGSRFISERRYRPPALRLFGIRLFSWLSRLVTGTYVHDSTSGYRAYGRQAIAFLARRYPTDFPEPESIVMLLNGGYRIVEVPVAMHRRTTGQSIIGRHDLTWRAAYYVLSNAIAILVSSLKSSPRT